MEWRIMSEPLRRYRRFIVILIAVAFWQLVGISIGGEFPTPAAVFASARTLASTGTLAPAIAGSLRRVLIGFAVALIIGTCVGLAAGTWRRAGEWVDPWINTIRPIAPFAWIPLAILWFGAGDSSAVFIVAYAAFFPLVVNTLAGTRLVDPRLVQAARTLGAQTPMILRQVLFPAALPNIFVGARLGIGAAWASLIAAELAVAIRVGAPSGVGHLMIITLTFHPDLNDIVMLMAIIGTISFLLDASIRFLQGRVIQWPP